jgi:hypothetical protein
MHATEIAAVGDDNSKAVEHVSELSRSDSGAAHVLPLPPPLFFPPLPAACIGIGHCLMLMKSY